MNRHTNSLFAIAVVWALSACLLGGCGDDDAIPAGAAGAAGSGAAAGSPGDPCEGVVCDQPPLPVCVGEDTLRTYAGVGRCVDGACIFDSHSDAPCTDCCYGAEINLTGDPIGGGPGYSKIVDPAQATTVVSTAAELLDALAAASDGHVVYIDDNAVIDLTGEESIGIPEGVTLASGRGRAGSWGGQIVCDSYAYPLFRVQGAGVRLTGVRMRGPNPEIGDHDYDLVPHSGAIASSHPSFEVDNCELWAWGTNAVSLGQGADQAYVHHNFIHHTRRAGLGYGVVLNQADALIEGNLFDTCRHHIAATGRIGTSYEARYNIILEHANGHFFDMHGARDFDKRETKGIWRFDEGEGDVAEDTSIGYYHPLNHCTLTNMDIGQCWVTGRSGTGLLFDGVDDYLDCGNDPCLTSAEGTIEFWMSPESLGREMDLFHLFESAGTDDLLIRLDASNRVSVIIRDGGVEQVARISDATISDTSFHHVAVTQDGTAVRIYIDGVESGATGIDATVWTAHLSLTGSRIGAGPGSFFGGVLDEARVYSRALTAEEIALHYEGNADIAGNAIRIHHNTFRGTQQAAVVIRGVPAEGAWIDHNWFLDADPDHAVRQVNAQGNFEVTTNHYGTSTPLGTLLPLARGSQSPCFGMSPLDVAFDSVGSSDPDGRIVTVHWDFGDGSEAWGRTATHTFDAAGSYLVRLTVVEDHGIPMSDFLPVTVSPSDGSYVLDFWVKDSYPGPLSDFYRKQAFIDGELVWEDDVEGDEGWTHVSTDVSHLVNGKERVDLTFRAQNINAVSNRELIELDVYWDDVTLFGATVGGGDFESSGAWSHVENGSTSWSGRRTSADPHSGDWSWGINYPYVTACPAGAYGEVTHSVAIKSSDLLGSWSLDEGAGASVQDASLYGNHGVLMNMDPTQSWVSGLMSAALSFDGVDDHVACTPATSLASPQGAVLLWLSPAAAGSPHTFFEVFDQSVLNTLALGMTADSRIHVVVTEQGSVVLDVTTTAVVGEGAFHHVAVVQNGSGVNVFVDGVDAGVTGTNGAQWTGHIQPTGAWIGAGHGGYFAGSVDEIQMTALVPDAAEVERLHRQGQPIGHFAFDEGQGTSTADSSTYQHTCTLVNMDAGTCWVDGRTAGALDFDGADDYVECAVDATLSSPEGTIEFWLRSNLPGVSMDLLNLFEDGFENYLLIRKGENNRIYVRVEDDDLELVSVSSSASLSEDTYHHIAVTQDGHGVKVYIDGVDAGASGTNGEAWTDHLALTGLWMGGGHWSNFSGAMDEVRLYARALRPDEVMVHASIP